jgi:HEAT repeat protein
MPRPPSNRQHQPKGTLNSIRSSYTAKAMHGTFLAFSLLLLPALSSAQPSVDAKAQAILSEALHSKNPDTRKTAVLALSLIGLRGSMPAELAAMLDDKDVEVRLACVATLVDLKDKNTTRLLHHALDDEVPEVSFSAARALWALGDPDGEKVLLSVLNGETKTSSGYFTVQKRDALRMMHTPKTMFLFAVRQGAGFAPVPGLGAGIASMQGLLADPGVSGRAAAALLLGKDRRKSALEALENALNDKEASVRAAAVHSLCLRDDVSMEPRFIALLDDSKESVRLRAAAACLRLDAIKKRPRKKS